MALVDGHPVIRNRNHILNKAFTQRRTAAKMQFASIFNWAYQNLEKLQVLAGYSIYGEWMYALHGLPYTHLPSYFITYDLYDYEQQQFIEPAIARDMLVKAGFEVVPLLYHGTIRSYEDLEELTHGESAYAPGQEREGVYVKVGDGKYITHRWKMVRTDFVQGSQWNESVITRNKLAK